MMRQDWRLLAFLHWRYPAREVQALLPPGLEADVWEGSAYLGLVPFLMDRVRHVSGLWLPTARRFPETNVRTYVIGPDGRPGVWFFSLDAASTLAVLGGRWLFGLPYRYAGMSLLPGPPVRSVAWRGGAAHATVASDPALDPAPALPGSREFWLVERYLLWSLHRGRLWSGRVWHEPYQIQEVGARVDENLIAAAGLRAPGRRPDLVHASPGVEVQVWPLRPAEIVQE